MDTLIGKTLQVVLEVQARQLSDDVGAALGIGKVVYQVYDALVSDALL